MYRAQLKLYRFSHPTEPLQVLQEAAAYVVVQGRKQVTVGGSGTSTTPRNTSLSRWIFPQSEMSWRPRRRSHTCE